LADSLGLDQVDQLEHLTMQLYQVSACLPKTSIGFGALLETFPLCGLRCDVPRPCTATVGEHLGLMQMSLKATAIRFSTAAFERVNRAGQERLSFKEDLLQLLDAIGELEQLSS
jgi:hypothetical protein